MCVNVKHVNLYDRDDSDGDGKRKKGKYEDEDESSEDDSEDGEKVSKRRGRPRADKKDQVKGFTDIELRRFIKSLKKFGRPKERLVNGSLRCLFNSNCIRTLIFCKIDKYCFFLLPLNDFARSLTDPTL